MWLKQLIMKFRDLKLSLADADFELCRYQRIHNEYLKVGRQQLIQKYQHQNLTYIYKYLNTDIYQQCLEDYRFVSENLERCHLTLQLISIFSPDIEIEDLMIREEERIL